MNDPRPRPYVWVSWITGLLAETDECRWKPWFKSHHRYAKQPGDGEFDLARWTKQHDAMTTARAEQLRSLGWITRVEEENSFRLDGQLATLSGKPDLVGIVEAEKRALVIDEKSGRPRPSDAWQVLLYMFALPLVWSSGWRIDGEVEYRGSSEAVPASRLDTSARTRIINVMKLVGGPAEPPRSPSLGECRFCDIAACPERLTSQTKTADVSAIF